jgi:hypothetical protein
VTGDHGRAESTWYFLQARRPGPDCVRPLNLMVTRRICALRAPIWFRFGFCGWLWPLQWLENHSDPMLSPLAPASAASFCR